MQPFSIDYITGNSEARSLSIYNTAVVPRMHAPDIVDQNDSIFSTPNFDDVYRVMTQDVSLSQITPTLMDDDVKTAESRDLSTPSPTRDSGIDSDSSPIGQSADTVSMTIRDLEKKAAKSVQPVDKSQGKSDGKPPQSYIALIAMAILSSPDRKLTLCDIYKHIRDNHSYYDNEEKAWRNSIRYNLSVNECFMKKGKEETGKGNYWGIHPSCEEFFENGDFRRRHARRRARRNMKTLTNSSLSSGAQMTPVYTPMTATNLSYQPYNLPRLPIQPHPYARGPQSAPSATRPPTQYGITPKMSMNPSLTPYQDGPSTYGQYPPFYGHPMYVPHQGQQFYLQQYQQQQHHQQHDSKHLNGQQVSPPVLSGSKPADVIDDIKRWSVEKLGTFDDGAENQIVILS